MYIWDLLKSFLDYFGFNQKSGKLVFIGLDDAGKTTLLNLLKFNKLIQPKPNQHVISEELILNNITLTTFDLGGHTQVRRIWKEYFTIVDAIVFIIDASKTNRFNEVKSELDALLSDEEVLDCPILILANKIDNPTAVNDDYIKNFFNLKTTGKGIKPKSELNERPIEVFMCSLKYKQGYGDGFKWLSQYFD